MDLEDLLTQLSVQRGVLVTVHAVQGSGPREVGAWMAVFSDQVIGSVGGGHLEWDAMDFAREALRADRTDLVELRRYPLGPRLGQCCGGVVHLQFQNISAGDLDELRTRLAPVGAPLGLFGGGHVGKALIKLLADLPFEVTWIDSRDEVFPDGLPSNVRAEHSDPVHAAVADLAPGSAVLVMSFSHAEDLEIIAACLARQRSSGDLGYIGLIGSLSKRALFRRRLLARGYTEQELDAITCPIGLPGIEGKAPSVVAVAVAAQLLRGW